MNKKDMTGKVFGRLKVIEFAFIKDTRACWKCLCVCGTRKIIDGSKLRSGGSKSCGCLASEIASKWLKKYASSSKHKGIGNPMFKHGESNTVFFKRFMSIKQRCNYPKIISYNRYGGRGIKFEWKSYKDFKMDMYKSFLKHSQINGVRNTTIERIDNDGNYCKENCRWATIKEQALNRRTNRNITYNGKTMCMTEWDKVLNFPRTTVQKRIQVGFTELEAITTPLRKHFTRP